MSTSGNPLELSSWGLPPEVLRRYHELGITQMFEWQADCLRTGKVLTGGKLAVLWSLLLFLSLLLLLLMNSELSILSSEQAFLVSDLGEGSGCEAAPSTSWAKIVMLGG